MAAYGTRVSRTYEPDDPELGAKRVRPFRLHELEHIPRDQRDIYQGLLRAMPEAFFAPGFSKQVSELLEQYLGFAVDIFLDSFRVVETNRLRSLIPGTTCLVIIGLSPRTEKIVVEVDLEFAYRIVGALLGTKGKAIDIHRPLTEIEQGVFLFIALKVLSLTHDGLLNPEQLSVRIEDIRNDVKSAADVLRTEHRWLCITHKLAFDVDVGAVRILVPEGLATGMVLRHPPPGSALADSVLVRVRERLKPFLNMNVEGWVEAGSIELSRPDLEALEPGDIILLEHSRGELADGALLGPATMRIGLGRRGALEGQLHDQDGKHVFEIQQIIIEQTPPVYDPVEGHGEMDNPEQVVAEYEDHAADEGDDEGYDEGYEEGADGGVTADDVLDEDWGIDDANDGDDEGYEDYDEGYDEGGYEEGGAEEGSYEEGGDEEGGDYDESGGYDDGGGEVDDNLAEAGPLLGDIPMVVVVELGRVQLTADEVIRMRAGQLIELGRSPTDPVDLVVNGKLVAKGELVEIEGALGVKLVSLVKGEEQ